MPKTTKTENITIVLNRPKYPGNVGSVARCAKNMGIERIVVVGNRNLDEEEMKTMATHVAADIVDNIRYFDQIEEALAGFHYIVGTTSRRGNARGPVVSPREMAERLPDISEENDVALLFGPEDTGLSNDELRFCHLVVAIPASSRFKSINLSHAVMILCYEIFISRAGHPETFTPRLATSVELEGMYDQAKVLLTKIDFLNPQNPDYSMMQIRRLLSRTKLLSREVKILRGVCRQIEWYAKNKNT
ncbi:MAG: RNA methyltransferase [Deltaproteobacteria bacterium]|nr:RNA methyltransferase [Deltaproteobacteria bacterium]